MLRKINNCNKNGKTWERKILIVKLLSWNSDASSGSYEFSWYFNKLTLESNWRTASVTAHKHNYLEIKIFIMKTKSLKVKLS